MKLASSPTVSSIQINGKGGDKKGSGWIKPIEKSPSLNTFPPQVTLIAKEKGEIRRKARSSSDEQGGKEIFFKMSSISIISFCPHVLYHFRAIISDVADREVGKCKGIYLERQKLSFIIEMEER